MSITFRGDPEYLELLGIMCDALEKLWDEFEYADGDLSCAMMLPDRIGYLQGLIEQLPAKFMLYKAQQAFLYKRNRNEMY